MAKMTKATHNGTCQACGRVHAVRPRYGTLAKHGYTVNWGAFWGTCPGSHHEPLEVSREKLDETVQKLQAEAKRLQDLTLDDITSVAVNWRPDWSQPKQVSREEFQSAEEMRAWGIENPKFATKVFGGSEFMYATDNPAWTLEEVAELFKQRRQRELRSRHSQADNMLAHAKGLLELVERRHGKPLIPREDPTKKVSKVCEGEQWNPIRGGTVRCRSHKKVGSYCYGCAIHRRRKYLEGELDSLTQPEIEAWKTDYRPQRIPDSLCG